MCVYIYISNKSSPDASIQCELLYDERKGRYYPFDIADLKLRRCLVRRVYFLLMLEIACGIPCMEIILMLPISYNELYVRLSSFIISLVFYSLLYKFRDWRRAAPYKYLVYLVTAILNFSSKTIYLLSIAKTRWVHLHPVILMIQLLVLALFTKQQKVPFTQGVGVIIIFLIFGLCLLLAYFLNILFIVLNAYSCTVVAWYIIYDTSLMLSERHAYNIEPEEYFFAATNLRADLPVFLWMIVRHFVLGPFILLLKIIRNCRFKEVC
ncbi:protein lifeguard 1 [Drosophila navojoa]|uniref:protein lifeguard 1 n=1 Tax=Drosophila navojoa TaxID=7232 RepID=UPI0011BFD879|nr:protein lifeguard 1 [Drosophila navojoa]